MRLCEIGALSGPSRHNHSTNARVLFWLMQISASACAPPIARVILYVKNIPKVAAFYQQVFGMVRIEGKSDG